MSEYTQIITDASEITIYHEITLGDIAIVIVLSLILTFNIIKFLVKKIWK
jgi:hypothetical protein